MSVFTDGHLYWWLISLHASIAYSKINGFTSSIFKSCNYITSTFRRITLVLAVGTDKKEESGMSYFII